MAGMKRGTNIISGASTLEFLDLVNKHASEEHIINFRWIVKRLLTGDKELKAEFIKEYGQEVYDQHIKDLSVTKFEQRKKNEIEAEERRIRQEARDKIEERRLNLWEGQNEVGKLKIIAPQLEAKKKQEEEVKNQEEIKKVVEEDKTEREKPEYIKKQMVHNMQTLCRYNVRLKDHPNNEEVLKGKNQVEDSIARLKAKLLEKGISQSEIDEIEKKAMEGI